MREEILQKLTVNGLLGNFKPVPEWQEAFEAYKQDTGDHKVGMKCSSCYRKVLKWLKR